MVELLLHKDKAFWAGLCLAMDHHELACSTDIQNGDRSTSATFKLLAVVRLNTKLVKNIAKIIVDLFFGDLVRKISYDYLHLGSILRREGQ